MRFLNKASAQLITVAAVLAAVFAATFVVMGMMGLVTVEGIRAGLTAAHGFTPMYVAVMIILLLFCDLFIAMPTLTVSLLSGYFLGTWIGGAVAATGMMFAGLAGYGISRLYGPGLLLRLYKDDESLQKMSSTFNAHGIAVLLMCRAVPILPEVCCCLAGANKMRLDRFLAGYCAATVPYAFIASFAGARSTLANPTPALITAILLSLVLWLCWVAFLRSSHVKAGAARSDKGVSALP